MGGKCVEMRVQGLGLYAVILADTEFQAIEEGNWLKIEKTKPQQRCCWGF
jgi:hypothetical protein